MQRILLPGDSPLLLPTQGEGGAITGVRAAGVWEGLVRLVGVEGGR